MENFIVSARKYRPQVFDDVIGQQAIANTLKRAVIQHKLAGAYLFCGPRGVGKTTCARIFAKTINCLHPKETGDACNECESCRSFNEGRSTNVQELNAAANNSVEDIRAIIEQVRIPPQLGHYKVIILDEVHMLTPSASNALLKTLEEPPSYVVFILATTEKQKILPTILSRCQIFDFNRMEVDDIITELKMVAEKEHITYDEAALNIIAKKADGGMRDSLSIFDQIASFSAGNITYEKVLECLNILDYEYYFRMTDLLREHDIVHTMLLCEEILSKGFDGGTFISGLASHMRDLLVSHHPETLPLLDVAQDVRTRYAEQAQKCQSHFLYKSIRICNRCANNYRTSCNKRLSLEIALIEVAQIGTTEETSDEDAGRSPGKILQPVFQETGKQIRPVSHQPAQVSAQKTPAPSATVYGTKATPVKNSSTNKPTTTQPATTDAKPNAQPAPTRDTIPLGKGFSIKEAQARLRSKMNDTTTAADTPQTIVPSTHNNAPVNDSPVLNEPYTLAMIKATWENYANQLPQEHKAEQGRMKSMTLSCGKDGCIEVEVDNEEVIPYMTPLLPKLKQFFHQNLHNNTIWFDFKVRSQQKQQALYDPQTIVQKMKEEYPAFASLDNLLNLHLE